MPAEIVRATNIATFLRPDPASMLPTTLDLVGMGTDFEDAVDMAVNYVAKQSQHAHPEVRKALFANGFFTLCKTIFGRLSKDDLLERVIEIDVSKQHFLKALIGAFVFENILSRQGPAAIEISNADLLWS